MSSQREKRNSVPAHLPPPLRSRSNPFSAIPSLDRILSLSPTHNPSSNHPSPSPITNPTSHPCPPRPPPHAPPHPPTQPPTSSPPLPSTPASPPRPPPRTDAPSPPSSSSPSAPGARGSCRKAAYAGSRRRKGRRWGTWTCGTRRTRGSGSGRRARGSCTGRTSARSIGCGRACRICGRWWRLRRIV